VLEAKPDVRAFEGLHLTWDEMRGMAAAGIDIQAHTVNHPILTRVGLDRARAEAVESKAEIETEIGSPVRAFAFPNGAASDWNPDLEAMLGGAGFEAAFTLEPGPEPTTRAQRHPMRIRRVPVQQRDTLPRFAAKTAGVARIVGSVL
jgi:peptidoglycan/xylan/chitin deacetylase (PgdA/CDA1 family)